MQEEKLIRGFRGAILIPIWAFTFAGLADACLALEQRAVPRSGAGSIAAPGTPNGAAGAQGQLGITNKGRGSITPGEPQHTSDCAAAAPGSGNGTDCAAGKSSQRNEYARRQRGRARAASQGVAMHWLSRPAVPLRTCVRGFDRAPGGTTDRAWTPFGRTSPEHAFRNPAWPPSGRRTPCCNNIHACFRRRWFPAMGRGRADR